MMRTLLALLGLAFCASLAVAQDEAKPKGRDYGEPITVDIPPSVRKQMEDQAVSIARLRIDFENQPKDGAALEFEDMRTEVPVIFAAFIGERCDRVLNYQDWKARKDHYIDLAFSIKTLPKRLEGMKVHVEHSHMQGEVETTIRKFDVPVPAAGDPWNDLRLHGSLPGVNRYRLIVNYTDAQKKTAIHGGFSHWVVVQAPPMFEFASTVSASATSRKAGTRTLISAEARVETAFLLHAGLKPEECSLRITRRGKRELYMEGLPADVRALLEKERAPGGWHEVGRGPLKSPDIACIEKIKVEDLFVGVTFRHVLNISTATLPMVDEWDYRFELIHKSMTEPLEAWDVRIDFGLATEADMGRARLRVRATGAQEVTEAPISK